MIRECQVFAGKIDIVHLEYLEITNQLNRVRQVHILNTTFTINLIITTITIMYQQQQHHHHQHLIIIGILSSLLFIIEKHSLII